MQLIPPRGASNLRDQESRVLQALIDDLDPAVTASFHLRADGQLAVGFLQQDLEPFQKDFIGV